jgi:hypothetical protein
VRLNQPQPDRPGPARPRPDNYRSAISLAGWTPSKLESSLSAPEHDAPSIGRDGVKEEPAQADLNPDPRTDHPSA